MHAPTAGEGGGRIVLDIGTGHPAVAGRARGRIDLTTATHEGVVRVRLRAADGRALAGAGSRQPLLLDGPGGRVHMVHRIVLGAGASAAVRAAAGRGPVRAQIVAQSRLVARGRAPAGRRRIAPARAVRLPPPSRWRGRLPPRPRPVCDGARERATAGRTTLIALRCMGDAPRIALADGRARRGTVSVASAVPGATLLSYRAPPRRGRADRWRCAATNQAGATVAALPLTVRPFTMRAIGDSITAGFGFFGDGSAMGGLQLPFCIPPDSLNDRCSSNSSNGPSSGGPPAWSSDFGYGNGVAWSAQFAQANGIASSAFENRAVSGSAPVRLAHRRASSTPPSPASSPTTRT